MDIKFLSSVIFVRDIQISRNFYETLLNQKVAMDHGLNVGFEAGFALWQVEHAHQIMFGSNENAAAHLGSKNFELYFESADLDATLARVTQAGVPFVHPLFEQPWGQRVFRVYDPDGHIVELGEPMSAPIFRFLSSGMSVEEIAQRTAMPVEIVRQISETVVGELE